MKEEFRILKHQNAQLERDVVGCFDTDKLSQVVEAYVAEKGFSPKMEIIAYYPHIDSPLLIRMKVTVEI